jgi:hypothetical protein
MANQLQQPLIVYPANNEAVDASSSTVEFYLDIRGVQCTRYRLYIYDVATNSLKYDSNLQALDSTLYDGDRLSIIVDIASLGADSYYWKIDLYWDTINFITSNYYTFVASTPPSIGFVPVVPSTITTPSYEFIGTYSQAEGVTVKHFTITVYDADYDGSTNPEEHIIESSGEVWSNNIRYTANGLISGETYQVQITGLTQENVAFSTPLTAFNVTYTVPNALTHPTAILNPDTSVSVNWGNVVAIEGTTSGTTSYATDYLFTGNIGLYLESAASVSFDVDFSAPFTVHWIATPESGFTGDFGEIKDTSGVNFVKLGYDGTKFYMNINGDYYYDAPETLTTNPYKLAIISDAITLSIYHKEVV